MQTTNKANTVSIPIIWQKGTWLQILAVTTFFSLKLLLDDNMGSANEVDVLPLARQYADPTWIPGDWYLNQPPGYRMLFQTLFGKLAASWGFLATSLIGRLFCYTLISSGLVLLAGQMGLSLPLLLLAVGLFLYLYPEQGIAASEWIAKSLEAKSLSYGFLLLAIGLMLQRRYRWMALLLGLATSFHVLVGGWAFVAIWGWLFLRRRNDFTDLRFLGSILLIYLAGSVFALPPILHQLLTPNPPATIQPSYIYVFVRLPHHLNPLSWQWDWWIKPLIYLIVLAFSVWLLQRQQVRFSKQYAACIGLAEFTLITLVPFMLGLVIAPFDSQGIFLQYYPFRLGDVMLPLNTSLLFACAIEQTLTGRARKGLLLVCILILSWMCSTQAVRFQKQLVAVQQFPSKEQGVDPEWKAICAWVRNHTPKNAVVVSSPVEFENFSWLTERPTIAKFKLLPQTKTGIVAWYERLVDLSGNLDPWSKLTSNKDNRNQIKKRLTTAYNNLTTAGAKNLMLKYRADYFITRIAHKLDLPIAYHNSLYILYTHSTQLNKQRAGEQRSRGAEEKL